MVSKIRTLGIHRAAENCWLPATFAFDLAIPTSRNPYVTVTLVSRANENSGLTAVAIEGISVQREFALISAALEADVTTTDAPTVDGTTILAGVRRIAPLLRDQAAEVEAARRLTEPVVDALRDTGVFRMSMPRDWGGPELDLLKQVEILEVLSAADASAGWCAMIGSDSGFYAGALSDADARELYPELDAITAGFVMPAGKLEITDGGYRLSGRWSFGSGCTHADVVSGGAVLTEGGVPVLGPDGRPQARVALLPAGEVKVLDTWHTTGLCGTGSNDYVIEGVFIPTGHTFGFDGPRREGTLYRWPGLFVANFVGVPLGAAADAIESAMEILASKVSMPDGAPARDEPRVRAGVARAQAMVGSARSYAYDTLGSFWSRLESGGEPSLADRAALAGCLVHTATTCRDAVSMLVEAVGTAAIRRGSRLERHHRDLITMGQHIVSQPKMREWAGGLWFGQIPPNPIF
jgi:alkylation response protein AidB-like acyl-CoA dehydrogenase